jgi:hypothetical protein
MRLLGYRTSLLFLSTLTLGACGKSDAHGPNENMGLGGASGSSGSAGSSGGTGTQAGSGGATGGTAGSSGVSTQAGIQMRFATPGVAGAGSNRLLAFSGGGALRPGLESLEYFIYSVQICESMDAQGSGFGNAQGCLELYRGDPSGLPYDPAGDWTGLADQARASDAGFVDLLNPSAREALSATTELRSQDVRSYHYGIITWSLPIKFEAAVPLFDGTFLYTHDGPTTYQTIGADNFRDYFTSPTTSLAVAPAEKAVVILGNGGNWFKFQNPLTITEADIAEHRQWVLDLVFNPEGIVKGFAGDNIGGGSVREQNEMGQTLRGINVPMLDLAPVPHRASEQVVRESYLGHVSLGAQVFDARIELYSVDGDPNQTVYGVDVKSLITAESRSLPPELSKISYLVSEPDGSLSFQSFKSTSIITGFQRVAGEFGSTTASLVCATHGERELAEGGSALVVESCPARTIEVTFDLVGRSLLDGDVPTPVPPGDAGPLAPATDAGGGDAATPDAGH